MPVSNIKTKLKNYFAENTLTPLFMVLILIALLFVIFRMRVVDMNYRLSDIREKINQEQHIKKELLAEKAKLLSVKKLRSLAEKHNLSQPKQSQVLVIP